jgi:hypothetical protein
MNWLQPPSGISLDVLERIIQMPLVSDDKGMGEPTQFRCHCGGVMHRFDPTVVHFERLIKEMGKPRYSRRKRQAKKNHKKWRESQCKL